MKNFGWFCAYLLTIVGSMLWSGYVLSVMWGWFIVSAFGIHPLTINSAIGLSMVVSYLTFTTDNKKDERSDLEKFVNTLLITILKPAFALFFGWIVRMFA